MGRWVDRVSFSDETVARERYLERLVAAPFQSPDQSKKPPPLVNAYKAFTLRLVLDHWPVESIQDTPPGERWEAPRWQIGPHVWSLNQLEHEQIRPRFVEPRVHFALACAAISLGRIGETASLEILQIAADADASRDVRHQCAVAIDRIGRQSADRSLFDAYRSLDESRFNSVTVGSPAPHFTLADTSGIPWHLADYLGRKTIVLVWIFADWCPVCHGEFRELLELEQEFAHAEIELVTIQCHEPYRCRVMVGQELIPRYWFAKQQAPQVRYQRGLWWRHLSDPAGAVAAIYGAQPLAFAVHSEYINRPATVIIDPKGIVQFAYYGTSWGDRPTIRQTLDMVRTGDYSFEHPKRLHAMP